MDLRFGLWNRQSSLFFGGLAPDLVYAEGLKKVITLTFEVASKKQLTILRPHG